MTGARYQSLLELRRARRDPIGFLQALAAKGDVVEFALSDQRAFLLSHPSEIEEVLVTHDAVFAKPPALDRASRLLGRGLLTAEPPLHTIRRRTIAPALHHHRMNRYADMVAEHVNRRTETWRSGDTFDVVQEMAAMTLGIVGEAFYSADLAPIGPDLRRILATAIGALDPLVALIAPMRRLRPARAQLHAIVQNLIDRRVADPDPPDDLLTLLLQADGPEATPEQLRDDVLTMLLAGHDTIANGLTWTWSWLSAHPAAEAIFHEEVDEILAGRIPTLEDVPRLSYTRSVLAESLRLSPPAWIIARRAIEKHVCNGVVIPAGGLVLMSPYLVHRDRRFYADSLTFDPGRWTTTDAPPRPKLAFFPFGAGRRSCIGESFAWMEGVLVLAAVARRWRLRAMDSRRDIDPCITLRPRGPMPMRIETRR